MNPSISRVYFLPSAQCSGVSSSIFMKIGPMMNPIIQPNGNPSAPTDAAITLSLSLNQMVANFEKLFIKKGWQRAATD